MIEPAYLVELNSKPANCQDDPKGPWAADVVTVRGGSTHERSARWLVAEERVVVTRDNRRFRGHPEVAFKAEDAVHHVQECDVESVRELSDVVLGGDDGE